MRDEGAAGIVAGERKDRSEEGEYGGVYGI